tara:strand:- start:171 stop:776 length:606 start_codon:yes stop_codon:yes gene_type:complete
LIKRTTKKFVNSLIKKNNLKVLDIGCGYSANENAIVICDVQDLSSFYKEKNFVQISGKELPFKDKEFDFVIASHVLEHVNDPVLFLEELQRVAKSGYIEVPTKLEDNLVFENKKAHLWHLEFDDLNQNLIISNKRQIFEPILTVSSINKFRKYFSDSLIIQLLWEDKINYSMNMDKLNNPKKISNLSLIRKFISKKIRSLF